MKTNKRKFSNLLLVVGIVVMSLVSCNRAEEMVILHLDMPHFNQHGKTYIAENDSIPRWMDNDTVNINNEDCVMFFEDDFGYTSRAVTRASRSNNYLAIYPHNAIISEVGGNAILQLPRIQKYELNAQGHQVVRAPMVAQSDNADNVQFYNMGAVLAIDIVNHENYNIVVDYICVSSSNSSVALWGQAEVYDIATNEPYYHCTESPATHDSITVNNGTNWNMFTVNQGCTKEVFVYVPSTPRDVLNKFSVTVYTHHGSDAYNYTMTQLTPGAGNVLYNELAYVPFATDDANMQVVRDAVRSGELSQQIEGAIPNEVFSVSATKQVYFSIGNLQYKASGDVWRFAENQTDYIGLNNNMIGPNDTSWIDLFGWGTSGYDNTANDSYAIHFMPYSSSTTAYSNTYNAYGYGPSTNMLSFCLTGASAQYDWGVHNAISNGGNQPGMWRTLSYNEWKYLIATRVVNGAKGKDHSYSLVYVDNIGGILLYPDYYTQQVVSGSRLSDVPTGCAFLPFAGHRDGLNVISPGTEASYWSCDNNIPTSSGMSSSKDNAVKILATMASGTVAYNKREYRRMGCSVRLVHDKEE